MNLRISYLTGTAELRAATAYLSRRGSVLRSASSSSLRRILLLVSALVLAGLILMITTTPRPEQRPPRSESPAGLLIPLVIIGVLLGLALFSRRIAQGLFWRYMKAHGRIEDQYGTTDLVLTEEGPLFDFRALRVLYKWERIARIDEDDRYIYVAVGPTQAVAIPKEAFATTTDARQFCDAMRGKLRPMNRGGQ